MKEEITVEQVDQVALAESVSKNIPYQMHKDVLVKPLVEIMIEKEIQVPVKKDKVDDEGIEVNEYDEVETKKEMVPSAFATGIVLKIPTCLYTTDAEIDFKVGDTIVYNKRFAVDFDLLKDSQLVKPYDIISTVIETTEDEKISIQSSENSSN